MSDYNFTFDGGYARENERSDDVVEKLAKMAGGVALPGAWGLVQSLATTWTQPMSGPTRCKRCAAEASPAKAVDRMVTGEVVPPVTMLDLQKEAHATAREKGWWDDETRPDGTLDMADVRHLVPTKLALIHSEVSEALEDYRVGKMLTTFRDEDGKPEGFGSELADVIIRIFDLTEALDLNMEAEVKAKMSHNRCRSHRHGGKTC